MGQQTTLQKIQDVRAKRGSLDSWHNLLEHLPEGSELCMDANGRVIGINLQITYSFTEGNMEEALDNMVNHLGFGSRNGKGWTDASCEKATGREDAAGENWAQ